MSIKFEAVSKKFDKKVILENTSFEILSGEIVFILGKSGMGKSVCLKQIIGLIIPDSGKITVNEHDVTSYHNKQNRHKLQDVRKLCGMVFQNPALIDSLTIFENIVFGLRSQSLTLDELTKIAEEKLNLVHLSTDILFFLPGELSYGVQKRVSIARALVLNPEYLLFDEPTTGLDPLATKSINNLIYELSKKLKITSVVVSHDTAYALNYADRILFLNQGEIIFLDQTPKILDSKIEIIQDFFKDTFKNLPKDWIKK